MTDVGRFLAAPAALARDLTGVQGPVVLDVRWRLGGPPGIDSYREGHLPGAVFPTSTTSRCSLCSAVS